MKNTNYYHIQSKISFNFDDIVNRDYSYNSFMPELIKARSKRSKISMIKEKKALVFHIESKDITAFRASVNEVIGFGKIIDNVLKLCE
ncbi:MAG: hypothetical protein EU539_05215 [Promethearchaeota archaeon]|nr:MAG: hypothetical protein EU539_05215 [Candidatus Lokiarchaeota archaeon]